MKKLIFVTALSTLFIGTCGAAAQPQPTEQETCKANVDTTIQAIEFMQKQSGKEESLSGLTVADIRKIETEKGVCPASQAIKAKTYGSGK